MGTMAKAADTLYGKDVNLLDDYGMAKGDYSSALHGTGNYKKGLKYLYYCAEGVRNKIIAYHKQAMLHMLKWQEMERNWKWLTS